MRLLQAISEADRSASVVSLALEEDAPTAKALWLEAVEQTADGVGRSAKLLGRLSASWAAFETSVTNGTPNEDPGEVIGALLVLENTIRRGLDLVAKAREGRARDFARPVATKSERARGIAVVERCAAILEEAYRDIQEKRWWVMARRAELEDPGDSPVFDNPEELLQYLHDKTR